MNWEWLGIIREFGGFLAGGNFFNGSGNDVDIIIGVPDDQFPELEMRLIDSGFRRTPECEIDLDAYDARLLAGFKADYRGKVGYWDIQIANPVVARARRRAMMRIKRGRLHRGVSKRELYRLYDQMYEL